MALTDKLTAIADAIRAKTGKTDSMTLEQMPGEIAGITGGGGGGSADGLVTVTFMNGDVELFKRPVYIGDDCPEPVAQGRFDAPTKESTAQYSYTFYGWGASDGGAADANILKNITEDKTVYAIFTATVRYYTITYLDSDGVTVLKTASFAYGSMPSYIPEKDGYQFVSWTPAITTVTGDASYRATWMETLTLEGASWARLSELSASKELSNYFSVGDKKSVLLKGTFADITLDTTLYVYILHFAPDATVFGCFKNASGKDICLASGDTSATASANRFAIALSHTDSNTTYYYNKRPIRCFLGNLKSVYTYVSNSIRDAETIDPLEPLDGTLLACFPEALRAVMKTQPAIDGSETCYDYLRLLSAYNIFGSTSNTSATGDSIHYDYYKMSGVSPKKYAHQYQNYTRDYWIMGYPTSSSKGWNKNAIITTNGTVGSNVMTARQGLAPVFFV